MNLQVLQSFLNELNDYFVGELSRDVLPWAQCAALMSYTVWSTGPTKKAYFFCLYRNMVEI